ncbi:MAG: hypothetical protein CMI13_02650 [Oleibacter sp.]|nr:hypothetical protein [Thalassolituus sp.]
MQHEDDLDKTMLIPNPGGRRSQSAQRDSLDQTAIASPSAPAPATADSLIKGENPLLTEARDIIALATNLRTLTPANSVEQLRLDVENLFRQFTHHLKEQGIPEEVLLTARYLLCCLVDELVLSTPWGIESRWSQQTLLSKYHNETSGGEKFFLIANKLMEHPQNNLDLIELCYICLAMGFRGKYRVSQSGDTEINNICNMLYQPVALFRPAPAMLSPCWQAAPVPPASIENRLPPSLLFSLLSFVCAAVFIALLSNLNAQVSPLLAKVETIAWDELISNASPPAEPQFTPEDIVTTLRTTLGHAIAEHQLTVGLQDNLVVLRLVSEALFPPGSTRISEDALPDKQSLLQAIMPYASTVLIVGHTDSTGRPESNWTISRRRAEAVEAWLQSASPTIKNTITRGMADTQPLVRSPNASENRRVELVLLPKE